MNNEKKAEMFHDITKEWLEKGSLILTVKLNNIEDAEQIYHWFCATEKHVSADLLEIEWDKVLIDTEMYKTLKTLVKQVRALKKLRGE